MPQLPDPFDFIGQPRPIRPRAADILPPQSPEEEQSLLGQLGSGLLSGLGYIGSSLDKVRRAAWALPTGNARELAAIIPFSDALGITDPTQAVHGSDLLGGDENTPFLSGEGLGGLALDIALDPLTYLSFGGSAVSKLGQAAKKAGVLPKSGAARAAGLAAASPEAAKLAQYTGQTVADVAGKSLGGHIGVGLPWPGAANFWTADLTPLGNTLSGAAQAASGAVGALPVVGKPLQALGSGLGEAGAATGRAWNALFDRDVLGQLSQKGQEYGRELSLARKLAQEQALESVGSAVKAYGPDALKGGQEVRGILEGTLPAGQASAGGQRAAPVIKNAQEAFLAEAKEWGVPVGEIDNYFHRSVVKPELDVAHGGKGAGSGLTVRSPSQIAREEILTNIPGGTAAIEKMVADPFLSGTARGAGQDTAAAAQHIMQNYAIQDPVKAKNLAEFLYSLSPERQKIGLFAKEAMTDFEEGLKQIAQSTATAKTMIGFLAKEAVTGAKPPGGRSLGEVLANVGLDRNVADIKMLDALVASGKHPPFRGNPAQQVLTLDNHFVSREVADALERSLQAFTMPRVLEPVVKVWDSIQNLTKSFLTSPNPAFHARNAASGLWQNYILTGAKALPDAYRESAALLRDPAHVVKGLSQHPEFRGLSDAAATEILRQKAFTSGLLGAGPAQDVVGQAAAQELLMRFPGAMPGRKVGLEAVPDYLQGLVGRGQPGTAAEKANPLAVRGVGGRAESKFAPVAAGQKLGNEVEDLGRLAGFVGLARQGYSLDVATEMVKAAHVDYTRLTGFESQVMKRLVPFYSFARGNVPQQFRQILERPGGITANMVKASSQARDEFAPDYLGQGLAIPVGGDDKTRRYLSSLGLPFEQLGEFTTLRGLAGQLSPLLKYPYEQLSGQQLFSGRDLRDLHSRLGDLGVNLPQPVENLLMNSPLSRLIGMGSTLVDPRKSWADAALNLATGARVTDVDMQKARQQAIRKALDEELRGQPGVGVFSRMYFRPEEIQNMDPREQALARLYLAQEQRARQQRAQR